MILHIMDVQITILGTTAVCNNKEHKVRKMMFDNQLLWFKNLYKLSLWLKISIEFNLQ